MSGDLRRQVIDCLRVAGPAETSSRYLRRFPVGEWEAALQWLNISGVALAFWNRLQQWEAEGAIPREVRVALASNFAHQRRRVAVMMPEFDSLNRQFERAGIEYAAWKGFTVIPDYCPDACLRPIYDYDYLIAADHLDRAQEALQAVGYVRRPDAGVSNRVNFALPYRPVPSPGGLYAAALPRKVELHSSLWDEDLCRFALEVPARPLDRRLRRTRQGLRFYSLDAEDAFIFQALHVFQHILHNWCRLGWLFELAYFLEHRAADAAFWQGLLSRLGANPPLREVVALVISLASHLFQATVPEPVKVQLLNTMRGPVALWVELYGFPSAVYNFSEDKYSLFLYREFVRDEKTWREIRNSRLLPRHRPNRLGENAVAAVPATVPRSWRQAWYAVERLRHHAVSAIRYAWESARWDRRRRQYAHRVLS
jgi:hypothetical protein